MAAIKGIQTIGGIVVLNVDSDPSLLTGTPATIGSYALANDGSGLFYKSGAGDTAWSGLTTLATAQTLANKRINIRVSTISNSATPTPNADTDDEFIITALASDAVFGIPSGTPTQGQILLIRIKDNGTARALSFNGIYRFSTDNPSPTTTTINKTMYIMCIYNFTDTKWDCMWRDNF